MRVVELCCVLLLGLGWFWIGSGVGIPRTNCHSFFQSCRSAMAFNKSMAPPDVFS